MLAVLMVFAVSVLVAWRDVRRQQADLQAKLAQQQKSVQSPQQVLQVLPTVLPLPKPLTADQAASNAAARSGRSLDRPGESANLAASGTTHNSPSGTQAATEAPQPKISVPPEDLKPLCDYALACKACQAQLAAAQADLTDEKAKTQALGRERDDALRAAKGGSVLQRVARAAKWFVIGAAAGALAAKAAR